MTMTRTRPILVLGGTGKTGRRVVERLAARGLPTRVGSRSGEPPFDWEDRSTWAPALAGVGRSTSPTTRTSRCPGAAEAVGAFAELAVEQRRPRGWCCCPAAASPRPSAPRGRARHRRRADDPALDLVHAELQRGLHARARAERRDRAPGRRGARAVRRRRRHRRRRGRGADRRRPRGPALRADRPAPADLRRGRGGDRRGRPAGDPLRADLRSTPSPSGRRRACRADVVGCSPISSARSSTAATPTWRTASGVALLWLVELAAPRRGWVCARAPRSASAAPRPRACCRPAASAAWR